MEERGTAVVVGQGYVGLPLAVRAVEAGWRVVGYDVAKSKVGGPRSAGCVRTLSGQAMVVG